MPRDGELGARIAPLRDLRLDRGVEPFEAVGIEPERIAGIKLALDVKERLDQAEQFKASWRNTYPSWRAASPLYSQMISDARDLMPPLAEVGSE